MPLPRIQLRPARKRDSDLLLRWRNDPETRSASFQSGIISRDTHEAWFAASRRNPDRRIYIAEVDRTPVGQIRFDRQGESAEISIVIAPEFRNRGLGRQVIEAGITEARFTWVCRRLVARMVRGNDRSVAVFRAAGFRVESEDAAALVMARDVPLPQANEILEYKARVWATPEAAARYEKNVCRRSGFVKVKNFVEMGYVRRYAKGLVLDAGAGTGRFALSLHRTGERVVALDISAPMLAIAREKSGGKLPLVVGNLFRLPFGDSVFDSVVSITVLEHLPPYKRALAEIVRVLKPGGTIIAQFRNAEFRPRFPEVPQGRPTGEAFVVELTRSEIVALLEGLGMQLVQVFPYGLLLGDGPSDQPQSSARRALCGIVDRVLRLPLVARFWAGLEVKFGRHLLIRSCRTLIIVGRKPHA